MLRYSLGGKMVNKQKVLILCENSNIYEHEIFDPFNNFFNLDFSLKVIPQIKRHINSDENCVVVGLDFKTLRKLEKAGIKHKSFEDFYKISIDEARQMARGILKKNKEIVQDKDKFTNSLYYENVFLWDVVDLIIHYKLYLLIFNTELIKNIINREKPDLILLSDPEGHISSIVRKITEIPLKNLNTTPITRLKYFFNNKLKISGLRFYEKVVGYKEFFLARRFSLDYKNQDSTVMKNDYKVVMISDVIRHIPQVVPWAKILTKKDDIGLMIISNLPWPKKCADIKAYYKTFSQYDVRTKNSKIAADKRIKEWKKHEKYLSSQNFLSHNNTFLFDIFKEDLTYIFNNTFPKIIRFIEMTTKIIEQEKPNLIVLMDERSWPGKTVALVCHDHGVPTLITQHGLCGDQPYYGPDSKATVFTAYGEFTRKILTKYGIDPEQVVITGGQQWDELISFKGRSKEKFCREFGLDKNKIIILFAGNLIFDKEYNERELRGLISAVKKFQDVQLVIRAHPAESLNHYHKLIKEVNGKNIIVFKKAHDFESVNACDIFITQFSTVAMDAIIFQKPVITINTQPIADQYPYADEGVAYGVHNIDDLENAIEKLLNNPDIKKKMSENRERFIYEHIFKLDGKSADRTVELIEKIVKE